MKDWIVITSKQSKDNLGKHFKIIICKSQKELDKALTNSKIVDPKLIPYYDYIEKHLLYET